jgi:hypothetical protein
MGTAFQDLLWPFQIALLAPVAGGLGALLLVQRRTPWSDAGACGLLIWAVSGSGAGVPFVLATAAAMLYGRSNWRRLWVVAVPLALLVVWYLGWGTSEHVTSEALLAAPQYVFDAAAYTTAGFGGLSPTWGAPLAVAAVIGCVAAVRHRPRRDLVLLAGGLVGALSFWILAAVARADYVDPGASRYLYIGAVFLILIAVDCVAGRTVGTVVGVVLGLMAVVFLVANVGALRNGERVLRASDTSVKEALGATDIAAPVVAPRFTPDLVHAPQITAGPYLAAARDLGTPALSPAQLAAAPESGREHADQVLLQAERVGLTPASHVIGSKPPSVIAVAGGQLTRSGSCDLLRPQAPPISVEAVASPGETLYVARAGQPGVSVYVRRFGANFSGVFGSVPPGASAALGFPADAAPSRDWTVQLVARAAFRICAR